MAKSTPFSWQDVLFESTPLPLLLKQGGTILSAEFEMVFNRVVDLSISHAISYLGIVNNILIIVVFCQMGFNETVNISMTSIAVWDLIRCVCFAGFRFYGFLLIRPDGSGAWWRDVCLTTVNLFYWMAGYTSGMLAAYVAIERCLCVSMPFTVKSILTRKFVITVCVTISLIVPASWSPIYAVFEKFPGFHVQINETYIELYGKILFTEYTDIFHFTHLMSAIYPIASFSISLLCTIIITYHLKKSSKFRSAIKAKGQNETEEATSMNASNQLSPRDKQVVKMLMLIIIVHIICYIPTIVFFLAVVVVPQFNILGPYQNLCWVGIHIMSLFEMINASINIFIFFSMSTQFKSKLKQLFNIQQQKTRK